MIRINLLPIEKRKAERTPVPRLFLIIATAGTAAGFFFYVLWILLKINNVQDQIQQAQAQLDSLRPRVADFERLTQQKKAAEAKLDEISQVIRRDIEYWRAANALWDVLNSHQKVWIDDFKMLDAAAAQGEMRRHYPDSKETPLFGVAMRCHVAGAEVEEMTRFRNALKSNPVLMQCMPTLNFNPDWKVDEEKDYAEHFSLSFSVALFGSTAVPQQAAPKPQASGLPPSVTPAGGVK